MQEVWVQPLGQDDPLEEEMATHSSIFTWRIPWTGELGGLQSMGSQRTQHNLANYTDNYSFVFLWASNETNSQKINLKYCHFFFFKSDVLGYTLSVGQVINISDICAKSLQLCPTLYNPMAHSLPGPSAHGVL